MHGLPHSFLAAQRLVLRHFLGVALVSLAHLAMDQRRGIRLLELFLGRLLDLGRNTSHVFRMRIGTPNLCIRLNIK